MHVPGLSVVLFLMGIPIPWMTVRPSKDRAPNGGPRPSSPFHPLGTSSRQNPRSPAARSDDPASHWGYLHEEMPAMVDGPADLDARCDSRTTPGSGRQGDGPAKGFVL